MAAGEVGSASTAKKQAARDPSCIVRAIERPATGLGTINALLQQRAEVATIAAGGRR